MFARLLCDVSIPSRRQAGLRADRAAVASQLQGVLGALRELAGAEERARAGASARGEKVLEGVAVLEEHLEGLVARR